MTTKQSARLHLESVNRDCFVVLHTLHHLSALLAMTWAGLFQQSPSGGARRIFDPGLFVCRQNADHLAMDGIIGGEKVLGID